MHEVASQNVSLAELLHDAQERVDVDWVELVPIFDCSAKYYDKTFGLEPADYIDAPFPLDARPPSNAAVAPAPEFPGSE